MKSFTLCSLLLPSLCTASESLVFPRTTGEYGTNVATLALTDHSRMDPFAPKPEPRSIMVSAFYPVVVADDCSWKSVHAYPSKAAAVFDSEVAFVGVLNGTFEKILMQVCEGGGSSHNTCNLGDIPLVFFSTGLGLSRLWYSFLAQEIASFGFTVITLDAPYDADVVEFPNGRMIYGESNNWTEAEVRRDVEVRVQDARFVLDELSKSSIVQKLFKGDSGGSHEDVSSLPTNRAGIVGHSLGGATAASTMFEDKRFVGGIDLDGGLYGPVVHQGLSNPFMIFGHLSNSTSPTIPGIWRELDWKLNIDIRNSTHSTFTDLPLLADMVFGQPLPSLVRSIVGQLSGQRARTVVSTYVASFFGMVLKCEAQSLLQRPSKDFPEIVFHAKPIT